MKNWLELKLICNIPVFLGFTNFYCQFIQGFGRKITQLTSMLKTIIPTERSNSRQLGVNNSKSNRFKVDNDKEIAKKSRNLKNNKLFKS